jgi:hypothetical protein
MARIFDIARIALLEDIRKKILPAKVLKFGAKVQPIKKARPSTCDQNRICDSCPKKMRNPSFYWHGQQMEFW